MSALSYITFGTIGLIWLIIAYFKKIQLRQFLNFNIVQSVVVSLLITAVSIILSLLESFLELLKHIPIIGTWRNSFFQFIIFYIAGFPIIRLGIFNFSLLHIVFLVFIAYVAILSFMGKIPEIPYITKNIRRLL